MDEVFTAKFEEGRFDNFTMTPNIVDEMGLDPFAFRLYFHLRKVAGDNGVSYKSSRTLADATCMSTGAVNNAKRELVRMGLIRIELKPGVRGGRDYHEITLVNVWQKNHDYYAQKKAPRSQDDLASAPDDLARSRGESINIPSNNIPNNNITSPTEKSEGDTNSISSPASPVDDKPKKTAGKKKDGYFRIAWVKTLPEDQQDFVRAALELFHGHAPMWQEAMEKAIDCLYTPYGKDKALAVLRYYKEKGNAIAPSINFAASKIATWRWTQVPGTAAVQQPLPIADKPAPSLEGGMYV